jgi:Rad3-related DNA helicase
MRTTRFFQALTLTSFGMAGYNTVNNIQARRIKEELEKELAEERIKNSELQDKLDTLANKKIEQLESINENNKSLIENIQNIVNSKSGSSGSNSLIGNNIIDSISQFFSTLNFEQTLAIFHISGAIFILISLYVIMIIYFGDFLIKYFNLEEKYPKIANFIKFRRKFQNYYILINILMIVLVLFIIIYVNFLLLTPLLNHL